MPAVSEPLARVLAARRDALNGYFRKYGRGIDPQAMSAYLTSIVDPIVRVVPQEHAGSVTDALFRLGIPALRRARGEGGGVVAGLEGALVEHLPRFGSHLTERPAALVSSVANGCYRLTRELGSPRALEWIARLASVSTACGTFELLQDAGLVLAWRLGLAEAREVALTRIQGMTPVLREALVGSAELDPDPARRFVTPGSASPLGGVELLTRVGGFVGFGGAFATPPLVRALDERLYATDGGVVRELFADAFGARLCSSAVAATALFAAEPHGAPCVVDSSGCVRWDGQEQRLPMLSGASASAAVAGMAAATLASSHYVFVLGRKETRA